jgi:hypothetical protein
MEASELRIGNLVYVSDNETNIIFKEITPINIHNLMHLTGWDKSPIDIEFEPIPLTEEWLIKFGFTEEYRSKMHSTFYTENLSYYFWYENKRQYASFKGTDIVCQYVHQLQNLYFALTGEELTLKP